MKSGILFTFNDAAVCAEIFMRFYFVSSALLSSCDTYTCTRSHTRTISISSICRALLSHNHHSTHNIREICLVPLLLLTAENRYGIEIKYWTVKFSKLNNFFSLHSSFPSLSKSNSQFQNVVELVSE
jgi:hypothetical protein